jgi:nucleotide-binding universal stress UspA family protein
MFDHLLVGIDGQQGGRDALALAKLLLPAGGRLTLATIYPPQAYVWRGGSPAYQARDRDDARAVLEAARDHDDVEAELWCLESPSVGAGLHQLAEDVEADLLVVGSSRRGLLGRVMLGDDTRATTSRPSSDSSTCRSPRRTTAWSSAITTRIAGAEVSSLNLSSGPGRRTPASP